MPANNTLKVTPLYIFTGVGAVACAWYCWKLCAYRDTTLAKNSTAPDVKANEKIPMFVLKDVVDLKNNKDPETKPKL